MTATSSPGAVHPLGRLLRYRLLIATAAVVFALDQLTKVWIFRNLPYGTYHPGESIEVVPGFFYIVHIGNEGAAWGMLSGYGGFLVLLAFAALFAIFWFRHSLELYRAVMQFAFGLLVGGVLGNLVDRILHGHVIDFLDFHLPFTLPWILPDGRWPAFNVADCGITSGVAIYLIAALFSAQPAEEAA